jgi:GNAT superfamily N-acetyltransferase
VPVAVRTALHCYAQPPQSPSYSLAVDEQSGVVTLAFHASPAATTVDAAAAAADGAVSATLALLEARWYDALQASVASLPEFAPPVLGFRGQPATVDIATAGVGGRVNTPAHARAGRLLAEALAAFQEAVAASAPPSQPRLLLPGFGVSVPPPRAVLYAAPLEEAWALRLEAQATEGAEKEVVFAVDEWTTGTLRARLAKQDPPFLQEELLWRTAQAPTGAEGLAADRYGRDLWAVLQSAGHMVQETAIALWGDAEADRAGAAAAGSEPLPALQRCLAADTSVPKTAPLAAVLFVPPADLAPLYIRENGVRPVPSAEAFPGCATRRVVFREGLLGALGPDARIAVSGIPADETAPNSADSSKATQADGGDTEAWRVSLLRSCLRETHWGWLKVWNEALGAESTQSDPAVTETAPIPASVADMSAAEFALGVLRVVLGLPAAGRVPLNTSAHEQTEARPARVTHFPASVHALLPTHWELQVAKLRLMHAHETEALRALLQLEGLARASDLLRVPADTLRRVREALALLHALARALPLGNGARMMQSEKAVDWNIDLWLASAATANAMLHSALYDPATAFELFLPPAHLLAVYAPPWAPVLLPLLVALLKAVKDTRSKKCRNVPATAISSTATTAIDSLSSSPSGVSKLGSRAFPTIAVPTIRLAEKEDEDAIRALYELCQREFMVDDFTRNIYTLWLAEVMEGDLKDVQGYYTDGAPRNARFWVATVPYPSTAPSGDDGSLLDMDFAEILRGKNNECIVGTIAKKDVLERPLFMENTSDEVFDKWRARTSELVRLCVAQPWRRRHLASTLISTLENWVRTEGKDRVYLSTLASMTRAIRFYRSRGYELETPEHGLEEDYHDHVIHVVEFVKHV